MIAYLAKFLSSPAVASVLYPALSRILANLFESLAARSEEKAAVAQAKAAGAIEDSLKRSEALRAASKRLSDNTQR